MLELQRLRADTPGCDHVVHLNNCGSSLPPMPVLDAMIDYLQAEALGGGYETAADRSAELDRFHRATASYLNCDPSEIAFGGSAGDAWWRAFSSVPLTSGDRVLVTTSEYQANAFGWMQAADRGVSVETIPNDADGVVDLEAFQAMLDERVKLVSFTMISLANGAVQPAGDAARRMRATGSDAIFLLDACQAAGQIRLDVRALGCDFLVYTGRKFMRGPRGTAALYAREGVLGRLGPPVFIDGRSAAWTGPGKYKVLPGAKRFEFGEFGYAAKVALGVATDYMLAIGLDPIAERIQTLAERLRSQLGSIDGAQIRDEGRMRCGIVTFTLDGVDSTQLGDELRAQGVNTSVPHASAAQLDLGARGLDWVVRAGVHYFNTTDEIDRLCEIVQAKAKASGGNP